MQKILYIMATYKKFLIQQQTYNGTVYTDVGAVVDTQALFKVVCQECPFKVLPETKDLPNREWHDEDGDDTYMPSDGLKFKGYNMEVKFLYVGTEQDMSTDLKDFVDFICGRINVTKSGNVYTKVKNSPTKNVMLAVYDEYTKTGRRGVYVNEVGNDLLAYDDANTDVIGIFKIKFRVTDPVTDMTLTPASTDLPDPVIGH